MIWKHQNNQQQIPTQYLDNYPSTKKKKKTLAFFIKGREMKKKRLNIQLTTLKDSTKVEKSHNISPLQAHWNSGKLRDDLGVEKNKYRGRKQNTGEGTAEIKTKTL